MSGYISQKKLQNLKIAGLVPLTTQDWPENLSAVIFLQGCRWRCGYCHNSHLWSESTDGALTWFQVEEFLKKRRGLLDAVVISGGEPTLHPELPILAQEIKYYGFKVGLHTGGYCLENFKKSLPYLDWVAIDYKNPIQSYPLVTADALSGSRFEQALKALLNSGKSYEVRTTVHSKYQTEDILLRMARELKQFGVEKFFLQEFRERGVRQREMARTCKPLRELISKETEAEFYKEFKSFGIRWSNQ